MSLKELNVLVDGFNLELIKGTGIKTYGLSLIAALKKLGALPNVLISKYSLKNDPDINTAILSLFQEYTIKPWVRFNWGLVLKTLLGLPSTISSSLLPAGLIITQGIQGFGYLDDVSVYSSGNCFLIADYLRFIGRKVNLAPRSKIDLWHATYFTPIKIKGAVKVTTIHDIVPLRLPYTTTNDKGLFIQHVRDALKDSKIIICVSEHTKQDILRFFDVDPDRLIVTYQPVTVAEQEFPKTKIIKKLTFYNLEYQKYILFVGAIEPKKNLKRLIETRLSMDIDMPLVIVGKRAWLWEQELARVIKSDLNDIGPESFRNKIRFLDFVPPEDLSILYKGAQCLVFPSLYEGFGLPVLEAMTLGCPVITSSVASLPEICGDAALYVDPYDVEDIESKLLKLISDDALKTKLKAAGRKKAEDFNMENYLKRLESAYLKAL